MITKVLLLTLIAIVFYFILQTIRDGFQNAACNFKYSGTNFDECLNSCNSYDKTLCDSGKCRQICGVATECNNNTSNSCSLDKCAWSRAKNVCEVPSSKYYRKDIDNIIYRDNILFSNIDEEEGNYKIVRRPTKNKDAIQMYRFKGPSYSNKNGFNNSFIYVSDFYGESLMATFFFEFKDNLEVSEPIPLITSQTWKVLLVKKGLNNFAVSVATEKFGNKPFADLDYPMSIEPGFLYSFGIVIKNDKATLLVMNTGDTKTKITDPGLEIPNFIYGKTPFLLVGTNLERNQFFDGFIGEFAITRDATDIIDLKANSYMFPEKQIEDIKLDTRSGDTSLLTIQDVSVPSKIDFLGKIKNKKLVLYWARPEEGITFLKYYIIVVNNKETNKKFYLFVENNKCLNCEYTVPNLDFDTDYEIGITGYNSNGLGKELDYLPVKIQSTTAPIETPALKNDMPDMVSCNPDGTYTIGKDCDAMRVKRISSNLSDREYKDITAQLNEKINIDAIMNFRI
jgi:hypothetical protein